jgi:CDP-glucose 4,6-dehydratase
MAELGNGMAIGVVRGGNIIGGGDWSEDRIVPDFYRAVLNKTPLEIRNPFAIRPWQHVLSVCHAYLAVATYLLADSQEQTFLPVWNVGPSDSKLITVRKLVDLLSEFSDVSPEISISKSKYIETQSLLLDSRKIENELNVVSPWDVTKAVEKTAHWYEQSLRQNTDAANLLQLNLEDYLCDYETSRANLF